MKDFHLFREAFTQNLLHPEPSIQLIEWQVTGVLKKHFPQLHKCASVNQDSRYHTDNVFMHCVKTCDNTPPDFNLRWAGLLHDIGKVSTVNRITVCKRFLPKTRSMEICPFTGRKCHPRCRNATARITFYRHEVASEKIATRTLKKFRVAEPNLSQIVDLVGLHMYNYVRRWTDKAVIRFIKRVKLTAADMTNPTNFPLFRLRIADRLSRGLQPITDRQRDFEKRLMEYL